MLTVYWGWLLCIDSKLACSLGYTRSYTHFTGYQIMGACKNRAGVAAEEISSSSRRIRISSSNVEKSQRKQI